MTLKGDLSIVFTTFPVWEFSFFVIISKSLITTRMSNSHSDPKFRISFVNCWFQGNIVVVFSALLLREDLKELSLLHAAWFRIQNYSFKFLWSLLKKLYRIFGKIIWIIIWVTFQTIFGWFLDNFWMFFGQFLDIFLDNFLETLDTLNTETILIQRALG